MRKLTLDMDALRVQSFATEAAGAFALGTVQGRQKGNTGAQDTDCSAVDACASALGCSDVVPCRPTQGPDCPTADPCTRGGCGQDRSAVDACPSGRGCTQVHCDPTDACDQTQAGCPPGPQWSKYECQDPAQ